MLAIKLYFLALVRFEPKISQFQYFNFAIFYGMFVIKSNLVIIHNKKDHVLKSNLQILSPFPLFHFGKKCPSYFFQPNN